MTNDEKLFMRKVGGRKIKAKIDEDNEFILNAKDDS